MQRLQNMCVCECVCIHVVCVCGQEQLDYICMQGGFRENLSTALVLGFLEYTLLLGDEI